jgi:AcrR family transcriptional regulator
VVQRGPYAKGRERRERILAAACDAFAEQGYRGASLARIAERAGVSDAGLLHHFPSKQHLLLELLKQRNEQNRARVSGTLAGRASLRDALLQLCAENAAAPAMVQLFTVMAAESIEPAHPGHTWFRDRYRRVRSELAVHVATAQERGDLDPRLDAGSTATQLLAVLDGLQVQWLLDPDRVDMTATLRDFLDTLGQTSARSNTVSSE